MSLVHITGDINILRELPKPKTPLMGEVQGYMSKQERNLVKKKALEIIIQGVNTAQKRGAYSLEEAEILSLSVKKFITHWMNQNCKALWIVLKLRKNAVRFKSHASKVSVR